MPKLKRNAISSTNASDPEPFFIPCDEKSVLQPRLGHPKDRHQLHQLSVKSCLGSKATAQQLGGISESAGGKLSHCLENDLHAPAISGHSESQPSQGSRRSVVSRAQLRKLPGEPHLPQSPCPFLLMPKPPAWRPSGMTDQWAYMLWLSVGCFGKCM